MVGCSWINETLAEPVAITFSILGIAIAGISFYYLIIRPIRECEAPRTRFIKSLIFLFIFTLLVILLPKLREQWVNTVNFCLKLRNETSEVDISPVSLG